MARNGKHLSPSQLRRVGERKPLQERWMDKRQDPAELIRERWGIVPPINKPRKKEAKAEFLIAVLLALATFGYQVMKLPYPALIGAMAWAVCLGLFGRLLWIFLSSSRIGKACAFVGPVVIAALLWSPIYKRVGSDLHPAQPKVESTSSPANNAPADDLTPAN